MDQAGFALSQGKSINFCRCLGSAACRAHVSFAMIFLSFSGPEGMQYLYVSVNIEARKYPAKFLK